MAGSEPVEVALDAGPIIHLDEIDAVDLLADFAVRTPDAVWAEVGWHRPRALNHPTLALSRCTAPLDERVAALAAVFGLGAGEAEALALGRLRGCMVFTDDAAARFAAESLGLRVHGTLGVLIRAARVGHRSPAQVLALLDDLPHRSTLHLRASLLAQVIEQVRAAHGL